MAFSKITKNRSPLRTFVLSKAAWAGDYSEKPGGDIAIGLRLVSEEDIQVIRLGASQQAREMCVNRITGNFDDPIAFVETFNDSIVRRIVGKACCDPNDVTKSYFANQEDTVRIALTSDGVRKCFDEYEAFRIEVSPAVLPIRHDDLAKLCELIEEGAISKLGPERRVRMKKLLATCFVELSETSADYELTQKIQESPIVTT